MKHFIDVLKNYTVFSGRARRKEYWYFTIFNLIYITIALFLHIKLSSKTDALNLNSYYFAYLVAFIIPNIGLTVRRLHDVGKSGWFILIGFIPLLGAIWLFTQTITVGITGDNHYGSDPKLTADILDS